MKPLVVVAIVLIVAGVLGLVYGQFTYTKETHDAQIGPIDISVKDRERVDIPTWLAIGGIAVGSGMLVMSLMNTNTGQNVTKVMR